MIGETVGSYKITSKLGEGGMGVVYLAEHTLLGRKAAVKMLLPHFSQDPEVLGRFFNEARAATQVKHPGLVDVFDYGKHTSGSAFLIMEFLDGISLSSKIHNAGMVALEQLIGIVRQIAAAVGAAHLKGIVHRDLKPDNVFLVPDEMMPNGVRVKILDFGIAKVREDAGNSTVQTQAAAILGTPAYMSPEQCKGAGLVDQRTDIYALGCIMYEMASGHLPFDYPSPGEIMAAHLFQAPAPPSTRAPAIDKALERAIMRCLVKKPDERFSTMAELVAVLDEIIPPLRSAGAGGGGGGGGGIRQNTQATMIAQPTSAGDSQTMVHGVAESSTLMHNPLADATQYTPSPSGAGAGNALGWKPRECIWLHGVDGNKLMGTINSTGARPARVVPWLAGNQWLFSAALVKDDAPSWNIEIGVDTATLQRKLAENNARLTDLNSFGEGANRRYAAVMVDHGGTPGWWFDGLAAGDVDRKLVENGAMAIDVDSYVEGGQRKYAVVMMPRAGASSFFAGGDGNAFLGSAQGGTIPVCVKSWVEGGQQKFCGACCEINDGWFFYGGLDGNQVQQKMNEHRAWIADLDVLVHGGQPRYAVILRPL